MTSQQTAIEHLRVIRSLLERSQTYRAISAPAALFGGGVALAVALSSVRIDSTGIVSKVSPTGLLGIWLGILGITTVLNFFLLYRDAAQRGQSFVSDGMHTALRAFVPPMLVGGVVGICAIVFRADAPLAALIWILCYGLALLSTAHFSPRSLLRLGWAFLGLGLALTLWHFSKVENPLARHRTALASLYLGATFGALHIAYAVAVFLRKPAPLDPPDA